MELLCRLIAKLKTQMLAVSSHTGPYLSFRFDPTAVITSVHTVCVVTDGGHVVGSLTQPLPEATGL